MICNYIVSTLLDDTTYHKINNKKVKLLKVLKNSINGIAFLADKRYMRPAKLDAFSGLYFNLSVIPLIIILIIFKMKLK